MISVLSIEQVRFIRSSKLCILFLFLSVYMIYDIYGLQFLYSFVVNVFDIIHWSLYNSIHTHCTFILLISRCDSKYDHLSQSLMDYETEAKLLDEEYAILVQTTQ